ncbi:Hypothetical protein HVPorG_01714 [Roseomonas mucosa]|jgi:hypothetical protein|uniref:Uncharacterized protein conserved in bacteria n=1 Tax=Roseomonas mucosa TaxID=207340 RepID=A0A1S8D546_9PROT|nr:MULTISPECIES: DUF2171 domain-containing protein [Roseomonas]MBS5903533.1 DUF2171 domain-containing protein [Acetobacteraceae bacterium]MDT8263511.1 DUF2171 domain-containing protein [Roseomonas sp. DSM 102946]ATR21274.1 DUF2171 domain-containing protein [Roseomonas sp. FDAARGOS_362]MCG7353248.1 DUF2171 domain-containing protein [Roseomonas mucosa]MCG7358623.1 DUF2171 domain-containing protein [Roseomonas mucosa]
MADASAIKEHMEIIGADGGHIGTVDHVIGDRIKLTKSDRGAAGKHHYLPLGLIEDVDGGKARASFKAELAEDFWEAEDA